MYDDQKDPSDADPIEVSKLNHQVTGHTGTYTSGTIASRLEAIASRLGWRLDCPEGLIYCFTGQGR